MGLFFLDKREYLLIPIELSALGRWLGRGSGRPANSVLWRPILRILEPALYPHLLGWLSQVVRLGACVVRAVRGEGMCVAHDVCTCEWGHIMRCGHSVCASVWACAGQRYSDRGPTQATPNPPNTAQ